MALLQGKLVSKDIILEKLTLNNLVKFQNFIKNNWIKKIKFQKMKKVFEWQYKNNNRYNFFIAKKNKKIIGVQGFIPSKRYDKKNPNKEIFLAFLRVIEGKHVGVALMLHKKALEVLKPKFIAVIGIEESVHAFHKWLGFNVYRMNHHIFFSKKIKKFSLLNITSKQIIRKRIKKKFLVKQLKISNIKELINNTFYKNKTPLKSNEYLINRYLKNPFFKYFIFSTFKKKTPQALIVIKPIKFKNSIALRLVDYIGSETSFLSIYDMCNQILESFNAEYLDIYSYGISPKILKQAGFTNRYLNRDLIVPDYFDPYIEKNIDIYCAIKTQLNKKIMLFKGDGDGDRPNINSLN